MERRHGEHDRLPDFKPGEVPVFKRFPGPCNTARDVEDLLMPKILFAASISLSGKRTVQELVEMHDGFGNERPERVFVVDGITYYINHINGVGEIGKNSIATASNGDRRGKRFFVDLERGATLRGEVPEKI